jgi:DNA-binding SARP family transcriptional activator
MAGSVIEYRVLGTLEVIVDGERLAHGQPKQQRAVLAVLVLNANQIVTTDRLIDLVWGDDPPRTAAHSIQIYVSDLRRVLADGVIHTRPPGYVLEADTDTIDALTNARRLP